MCSLYLKQKQIQRQIWEAKADLRKYKLNPQGLPCYNSIQNNGVPHMFSVFEENQGRYHTDFYTGRTTCSFLNVNTSQAGQDLSIESSIWKNLYKTFIFASIKSCIYAASSDPKSAVHEAEMHLSTADNKTLHLHHRSTLPFPS